MKRILDTRDIDIRETESLQCDGTLSHLISILETIQRERGPNTVIHIYAKGRMMQDEVDSVEARTVELSDGSIVYDVYL